MKDGAAQVLGHPNTLRLEDGLARVFPMSRICRKVVFVRFLSINTEFDANV